MELEQFEKIIDTAAEYVQGDHEGFRFSCNALAAAQTRFGTRSSLKTFNKVLKSLMSEEYAKVFSSHKTVNYIEINFGMCSFGNRGKIEEARLNALAIFHCICVEEKLYLNF